MLLLFANSMAYSVPTYVDLNRHTNATKPGFWQVWLIRPFGEMSTCHNAVQDDFGNLVRVS